MTFRTLPTPKSVVDEFRVTAAAVNCLLYSALILYVVVGVWHVLAGGPQIRERQLPHWGAMPWLTVCLDNSTAVFSQGTAFVALGFGHHSAADALSGSCEASRLTGLEDTSRWFAGEPINGTRCQQFNLTSLWPFRGGSEVSSLVISGNAAYRQEGVFPKFLAVGCSDEPGLGLKVLQQPLLYLYPERYLTDNLARPMRVEAPTYELEKRSMPNEPLPWLRDSRQHTSYSVRSMGEWKTCVPHHLLRGTPDVQIGDVVFGFGLFIMQPTVTQISSTGVFWQLVGLLGSLGGFGGICFLIWRCIFVRPRGVAWSTDENRRTLHPWLQPLHSSACRGVAKAVELFPLRAEAKDLEQPLVAS